MSFSHSIKPKKAAESKIPHSTERAVKITRAFVDENHYITIDYEVNSEMDYHFMCVANDDCPFFEGIDWKHPIDEKYKYKGTFSFEIENDFPFETARICLYSKIGMRSIWMPVGGELVGKSPLIKECLDNQVVITPPGGKACIMKKSNS